jgi:3-oxoacyl-[acyl-carrier protein] reductase
MDLLLTGKTVLITGGASGLGACTARLFASEGSNVVIMDRQLCTWLSDYHYQPLDGNIEALVGDVTCLKDIETTLNHCLDRYNHLDVLINNAGIWTTALIQDMTLDEWEDTIRINLTGPFLTSRRVIQYFFSARRKGCIINITSPAAFQGSSNGHSHYVAAKSGLVGFTVSLARETAHAGIRVIGVAPGIVPTQLTSSAVLERGDEYLKRIPMGRFGTEEEIAAVVVFMASERAAYITGATIDVSGGLLMR